MELTQDFYNHNVSWMLATAKKKQMASRLPWFRSIVGTLLGASKVQHFDRTSFDHFSSFHWLRYSIGISANLTIRVQLCNTLHFHHGEKWSCSNVLESQCSKTGRLHGGESRWRKSQVRWRFVRSHDKPIPMGIALRHRSFPGGFSDKNWSNEYNKICQSLWKCLSNNC